MKTLNLDLRTYLITFSFKMSDKKFIFQTAEDLVYLLQNFDTGGVASIKILDSKNTFKRISKKDILTFFSWDTESIIYLKKHYFFN